MASSGETLFGQMIGDVVDDLLDDSFSINGLNSVSPNPPFVLHQSINLAKNSKSTVSVRPLSRYALRMDSRIDS